MHKKVYFVHGKYCYNKVVPDVCLTLSNSVELDNYNDLRACDLKSNHIDSGSCFLGLVFF